MNFKKRILSIFMAVTVVAAMGTLNVFADTQLDEDDYSYTKYNGEEGETLEDLQEMAEDYFDDHGFEVDADDFECDDLDDDDDETEDDETYVLEADDFTVDEDNYNAADDEPDELTYTYVVGEGEIEVTKITEDNGLAGKTLSYVIDKAEEAFEDAHYDVSDADFEQTRGPKLSSSDKTEEGESYTFECDIDDVEAESGYYIDDDIDELTYVYEVGDGDEEEDDEDYEGEPTYGSRTGWTSINSSLSSAASGSRIIIKMNESYTLPAATLTSIRGRDVDLVLDFGSYAWSINGMNVTNAQSIDLEAKFDGNGISSSVVNKVAGSRETMQLELSYSGKFGFKGSLTAQIDPDYARKYANLYYYNPSTNALEYQGCGMISSDGYATLSFNHASNYVIIVDSSPMGVDLAAGEGIEDNTNPITA